MKRLSAVLLVLAACGGAMAQTPAPASPPSAANQVPAKPDAKAEAKPEVQNTPIGTKVDLRSKWIVGDIATYDFEIMNRTTAKSAEDETKRNGNIYRQSGQLTRRVEAVDPEGVTLVFTITKLHLQASYGTKVVHFGSYFTEGPEHGDNPLVGPVKMAVNRPVTIRLDAAGQFVSVKGNEVPPPDPNKPDEMKNWQPVPAGVLGSEAIMRAWKPLVGVEKKPAQGVVGEKWDSAESSSDAQLGVFDVKLHHQLTDVKDNVATIATTADVELFGAAGPAAIRAKITSSKITGTTHWDLSRGTLKHRLTSQAMTMDAQGRAGDLKLETELATYFEWVDPSTPKAPPPKPEEVNLPIPSRLN